MSTKITDKLFTYSSSYDYVKQHAATIKQNYPNSIVLIGDEQMLWQPLTNSYVGVPFSKFAYAYNTAIPDLQEKVAGIVGQGNIISGIGIGGTSSPTATVVANNDHIIGLTTTNSADTTYQLLTVSNNGTSDIVLDAKNAYNFILDQVEEAKKYAVSNSIATSDNIYKLLLGDDSTYVEHEIDEFIKENAYTGKSDIFYNDAIYAYGPSGYTRLDFVHDTANDTWSIQTQDHSTTVAEYNPSTGTFSNIASNWKTEGSSPNLDLVLYTYNNAAQNSYNMSITEGIETLKEVAYILDVITDGQSDDSISLAYNIAYNNLYTYQTNKRIDEIVAGSVERVHSHSLSNPLSVITTSSKENYTGNVITYSNIRTAIFDSSSLAAYTTSQYDTVDENASSYVRILPDNISNEQINQLHATNLDLFITGKTAAELVDGTFIGVAQDQTTGTWGKVDNVASASVFLKTHEPVIQRDTNGIDTETTNDNLVTTVSWVLSYVEHATSGIRNDMESLNVNDKIQKYLSSGTYITYAPYDITVQGGPNNNWNVVNKIPTYFATYFVEKNDAADTVDLITYAGNYYDIRPDTMSISLSSTYLQDVVEAVSTYSYVAENALPISTHTVTLHTQTLAEVSADNTKDGLALANDVTTTIEAMFTWFDLDNNRVYQ